LLGMGYPGTDLG